MLKFAAEYKITTGCAQYKTFFNKTHVIASHPKTIRSFIDTDITFIVSSRV